MMTSDTSKSDQVMFECLQKVVEIIVQSRVLNRQQRRAREMNNKVRMSRDDVSLNSTFRNMDLVRTAVEWQSRCSHTRSL